MSIQMEISLEKLREKIGTTLEVLVEGYDPVSELWFGRSKADAPDIDGKVFFYGMKRQFSPGAFLAVRVEEALDYDLVGSVVSE